MLTHPLECVQCQARCLNHCHALSSLTHTQPYNSTSVQTPPLAWNFLQHILRTPCQGPRASRASVIKFHLREVKDAPWADVPALSPTLRFSRLLCFCGFQNPLLQVRSFLSVFLHFILFQQGTTFYIFSTSLLLLDGKNNS